MSTLVTTSCLPSPAVGTMCDRTHAMDRAPQLRGLPHVAYGARLHRHLEAILSRPFVIHYYDIAYFGEGIAARQTIQP